MSSLSASAGDIPQLLHQARQLNAASQLDAAKDLYLQILRRDATHFEALTELGNLAYESGYRSAARTAYEQAVRCQPDNPIGRVNLGNMLCEAGELDGARNHYEAALAAQPGLAEAHQGLGRIATESGDQALAQHHWRIGFAQRAAVERPYRGIGAAIPVLLLVDARSGNVPARQFLDERVFSVTLLCPEFFDLKQPLPAHALIVNAIGDADLCEAALAGAERLAAISLAPLINPPDRVRLTGRAANAKRLGAIDGVRAPAIRRLERAALLEDTALRFPLLLRSPGYHTGRHFLRVERREQLTTAIASLPGTELLAIEYLDARGADGLARKYRVMFIDHVLYPLHLAISNSWKVHYFSADMARSEAHREEERGFLEDMPGVLGPRVMETLAAIERHLGLDYAGIDFAVNKDGELLLFEANATMVIYQPDADPIWDYRRAPIGRVIDAARSLLSQRAQPGNP